MMNCNSCGNELADKTKFCRFCSAPQIAKPSAPSCKKCGSALLPNAKFCKGCGENINQTSTQSQNFTDTTTEPPSAYQSDSYAPISSNARVKSNNTIVYVLFAFSLLVITVAGYKYWKQEQVKEQVTVTTEQLRVDYIKNVIAANNHYRNKLLNVTGVVRGISKTDDNKIIIQFTGLEAILLTNMEAYAASYKQGQTITLICVIDENPQFWTRIKDCRSAVMDNLEIKLNEKATITTQQPLSITAEQYHADYEKNTVAADQKYKDRVLNVTGVVRLVGQFFDKRYYVSFHADSNNFADVEAILQPKMLDIAATYQAEQQLKLICIGGQEKIGEKTRPVLRDCHST